MEKRLEHVWLAGSILGISVLAVTAGCGLQSDNASCSSDGECPGDRACVGGSCAAPWRAGEGDATANEPDVSADASGGSTGPEAGGLSDAGRRDSAGTGPDASGRDPTADAGSDRALSCNEFYKCQTFDCSSSDFQCVAKLESRMPQAEVRQRDAYNECFRKYCQGTTGQERMTCTARHCGKKWKQCYTAPNDDETLTCSEYAACINGCGSASDPTQCRANCQKRATKRAQTRYGALRNCYSAASTGRCSGKQGAARYTCIGDVCEAEVTACYGC